MGVGERVVDVGARVEPHRGVGHALAEFHMKSGRLKGRGVQVKEDNVPDVVGNGARHLVRRGWHRPGHLGLELLNLADKRGDSGAGHGAVVRARGCVPPPGLHVGRGRVLLLQQVQSPRQVLAVEEFVADVHAAAGVEAVQHRLDGLSDARANLCVAQP